MKSIDIKMTSHKVESSTKSLRANWTREMVQDLSIYGGINVDELSKKILKEFRRDNRKKSIKNIFSNQKPYSEFHI